MKSSRIDENQPRRRSAGPWPVAADALRRLPPRQTATVKTATVAGRRGIDVGGLPVEAGDLDDRASGRAVPAAARRANPRDGRSRPPARRTARPRSDTAGGRRGRAARHRQPARIGIVGRPGGQRGGQPGDGRRVDTRQVRGQHGDDCVLTQSGASAAESGRHPGRRPAPWWVLAARRPLRPAGPGRPDHHDPAAAAASSARSSKEATAEPQGQACPGRRAAAPARRRGSRPRRPAHGRLRAR